MKILQIKVYRDGGTLSIITDEKIYCIDGRRKTDTKNMIYAGYPNKENSNIYPNDHQSWISEEMIDALKIYKGRYRNALLKRLYES